MSAPLRPCAPYPFSVGRRSPRSQLSAPLVPPSPFRWAVAPLARSCALPMCPRALFGGPSLPSLAAVSAPLVPPSPFRVGRRSPRSQLSAPPLVPPIPFAWAVAPLALAAERSPLCPVALDRPSDFIYGFAIDPEHGISRGDRVDGCRGESHFRHRSYFHTMGDNRTTTSTPAAFPRQHADAGQEADGKNGTNDAHADDRRVVRRQHGRQRRGRATAPGTRDVTRGPSSNKNISGREAAVEVIPWLRKGIARAGARVCIPAAPPPNGAAR